MSNPWMKISEPVHIQKFADIMSQEYAKLRLNRKDLKCAERISASNITSAADEVSPETLQQIEKSNVGGNCNSNTTDVKDVQCKFDKVYDDELKLLNKKYSGDAKAPLSFDNNHDSGTEHLVESNSEELLHTDSKLENRSETNDKTFVKFLRRCFVTTDGRMVTKSDSDVNGKRSACRVMAFPPDVCIEDDAELDMKLSSPALNQLNKHTLWNYTCKHKILDRKDSQLFKDTAEMGLDEPTRFILFKLIDNRMLLDINEVISTGKESIILHANSDPSFAEMVLPKECAIKVFKMILNDFRVRNKYIKTKHRFRYNFSNPVSKVLQMWAEKEVQNLRTLQKVGLNCPEIVCLKKHVLVMSFIGKDNKPAPKLRDVILEPDKWQSVYDEIVDGMHRLYNEGHLILPELSEHKILWWENKCWYIGVAQSVGTDHPDAFKFLFRNCYNISQFFLKKRMMMMTLMNTENLFKFITGLKKVDWHLWKTVDTSKSLFPF